MSTVNAHLELLDLEILIKRVFKRNVNSLLGSLKNMSLQFSRWICSGYCRNGTRVFSKTGDDI